MRLHACGATALVALLSLLAAGPAAQAPQIPGAAAAASATFLPFDPAVSAGVLPNGLRYYVRRNAHPARRLTASLVVRAGSVDEADDQRGLAHLLEHVAFGGGARFPNGSMVPYFQSIGAQLGAHVNAQTGYEETTYRFEIPSDRPGAFARVLDAVADIAGGLAIDGAAVERERAVVIEEWRGRLGSTSRVRDQHGPVVFAGTRYGTRPPMGDPDTIRTAPVARIRAFYDAWYRPERMALVIVGDVDPAAAVSAVESTLGGITAHGPATPPVTTPQPGQRARQFSIVDDAEATASTVQLVWLLDREAGASLDVYRRSLTWSMFLLMLNDRLREAERSADAPFINPTAIDSPVSPSLSTFAVAARVNDGGISMGMARLNAEVRRVRESGFTTAEWTAARRMIAAVQQRRLTQQHQTPSAALATAYVQHFLTGAATPSIEDASRLLPSVLGAVTLEDVTALARQRLPDTSRVVLVTAPRKASVRLPSEQELRAALMVPDDRASARSPEAPITAAATGPLMTSPPAAGAVVATRRIDSIGVTVVRFGNGAEAWLKPTDFAAGEVRYTMFAPGGTSLAPPEDFTNAAAAAPFVKLSGVAGVSGLELERRFGRALALSAPAITPWASTINGVVGPRAVEAALQLLHLWITAPGDDPAALALIKRQLEGPASNRGLSPAQMFGERIVQVNASNHYTMQPVTMEGVAALDRTRMMRFYRERFANAADFTLVMAGDFNVDGVIPLLARYVGSLPSATAAPAAYKDTGLRFPQSVERVRIEKGQERRSQAAISFFADPTPDSAERQRALATTVILEAVLRTVLRETLGQTYTVSVTLQQPPMQRGAGHIRVTFGGAPENIDAMVERATQEVQRLQESGPPPGLLQSVKQAMERQHDVALRQNAFWLGHLHTARMTGSDPEDLLRAVEHIRSLTDADVRAAFRDYYPQDRRTFVTLVPESAAPPATP